MTSTPARRARTSSGASGRQPGRGDDQRRAGGGTSAPTTGKPSARSGSARSSLASATVTRRPRSRSTRAAAAPLTPAPRPGRAGPVGATGRAHGQRAAGEVLGVEDAEAEGDGQPGDDPEAHDDGVLDPAGELEVVVDRRHVEHPLAGQLEDADLDDHRDRLDDEQPAEHDEQQLGVGDDGDAGERAADRQRAGVAHEDLGGEAFHHRKPKQAPIAAAATSAMSSGSRHLVALREAGLQHAGLAELPEADDDVRREDHERGAGREAVEPVGEVHGVARRGDDQVGEEHEADAAEPRVA
jgi:hypothetical protein